MRGLLAGIYFLTASCFFTYNAQANSIFSEETEEAEIYDPFEKYNRKIFELNNIIDKYTIKPLALTYRKYTTDNIRKGFNNFFYNLTRPVSAINSILQQDYKNSLANSGNFLIDSTIGILGIFKISNHIGAPEQIEDFGQTLAVYNISPGPYIVIPFLGPSNLRDLGGTAAGAAMNTPLYEAINDDNLYFRLTLAATRGIITREKLLESLDNINENSLDPYTSVKTIYYQYRQEKINNGQNYENNNF